MALVVLGTAGLLLLGQVSKWTTGQPRVAGPDTGAPNVNLLGKSLYTTYLFPFEVTSALLVIAVVGAVVLARRPPAATRPEPTVAEADADAGAAGPTGAARRPERRPVATPVPPRPRTAAAEVAGATRRRPGPEETEVDA